MSEDLGEAGVYIGMEGEGCFSRGDSWYKVLSRDVFGARRNSTEVGVVGAA